MRCRGDAQHLSEAAWRTRGNPVRQHAGDPARKEAGEYPGILGEERVKICHLWVKIQTFSVKIRTVWVKACLWGQRRWVNIPEPLIQ